MLEGLWGDNGENERRRIMEMLGVLCEEEVRMAVLVGIVAIISSGPSFSDDSVHFGGGGG